MLIKREAFIPLFLIWVAKKIEKALPEEDFDGAMFSKAVEQISKHNDDLSELRWPKNKGG